MAELTEALDNILSDHEVDITGLFQDVMDSILSWRTHGQSKPER